jgi:F0F1-type ATP synthase epsilon subunit
VRISTEVLIMANDKEWQRRTDEWIDATNESRKRKEKRLAQKIDNQNKVKGNVSASKQTDIRDRT